jgi:hypothetical protein
MTVPRAETAQGSGRPFGPGIGSTRFPSVFSMCLISDKHFLLRCIRMPEVTPGLDVLGSRLDFGLDCLTGIAPKIFTGCLRGRSAGGSEGGS